VTKELQDQPSKKMARKVQAGGLGGSIAIIVAAGLESAGVEVSPTLMTAITTVVILGMSYFAREYKLDLEPESDDSE